MAKHILPNISGNKSNQPIKLGQLIDYIKRNMFLQKLCRTEAGRLVPDLFIFLICLIWGKVSKNKLYKTFCYWSRNILNFNFSEKGLGVVSPPHFVFVCSRKMFLMLCSVNWPNFIVWLPLPLEILGSMCVTIIC